MSGSDYDASTSTFSNDGRIFQVEYAQKATNHAGTSIGIKCIDGVVLACENFPKSVLLVPHSQSRVTPISYSIGVVSSGLNADGRHVSNYARDQANSYKKNYHSDIPVGLLADQLSLYFQQYTQFGSYRPIGVSTIIGGYDGKPQLYSLDPNAELYGYKGVAIGKGKTHARTALEQLPFATITCEQAVKEAAKILYGLTHEEERIWEIEMGWITEANNWVFETVPAPILKAAEDEAKKWLEERDA
ncbi:putative Proteasome subunit alpha type-3 [Blattamonas nauphoetae]|uniref:Proteasome subunit alpha type-3 n=1 Tax=Blattamonas nauphoetae TaxID=2049346 RepID=A0ABQ9Y4W1_9EUKA|nr:putative Proteasome subunit alpha type-3 [Blattamonas nauphoetae]